MYSPVGYLLYDSCVLVLQYVDEPTALLLVAPYFGEASAALTKTWWQSRTRV